MIDYTHGPARITLISDLTALNKAVDDAIAARKTWMDAHMVDFAKFHVGDPIYDIDRGICIGHVTRLYRLHGESNPAADTVMCIHYEYEYPGPVHLRNMRRLGNTSSQVGRRFGTAAEAEQYHRDIAARIER